MRVLTTRFATSAGRFTDRKLVLAVAGAAIAIAVACGGDEARPSQPDATTTVAATPGARNAPDPATAVPDTPGPTTPPETQAPMNTATPNTPSSSFTKPSQPVEIVDLEGLELTLARSWQNQYSWVTDFNKRTVSLTEIRNLLHRDGIKPVDDPEFVPATNAPDYMRDREPVIAIKVNGDARAYPLAILMWQEIVNDTVGGVPMTITFCPLCNSAIAFKRTLDGQELTFGTSGNLRNSDLVMWDRQTETWWQQITGQAIVGQLAGRELELVPSAIIAWETFRDDYPDGKLLLRETNFLGVEIRPYDDPPYAGYDSIDNRPFAFEGRTDSRLPATARVLTIKQGDSTVAYPFSFLKDNTVVNDRFEGTEFVAFFDDGTLSAFLDGDFREQSSGSTTVFNRELDGQTFTFNVTGDGIVDAETGSVWTITGKALEGPMAGKSLEPVLHANHFWFAWAVFEPDTEVRSAAGDVAGPVSSTG